MEGAALNALGILAGVVATLVALWKVFEMRLRAVERRSEAAVRKLEKEATMRWEASTGLAKIVADALAEYKIHVAETYVNKHGLTEHMRPLSSEIVGLRGDIRALTARMDDLYRAAPQSRGGG